MPQKKATGLNWYGGPSGSSVWLGLGRLFLPAEFERAEVIRRSRRVRARAQRTREDAVIGTGAVSNTEDDNDNAVGEEANDSEQEPQNGTAGHEEGDDTPDGEDTATDQPADDNNEPSGGVTETQESEDAAETPAPDNDNKEQGGSEAVDSNVSNPHGPDTASGEAQPRRTVTASIRGGGCRFGKATTVVETPPSPSESHGREWLFMQDRDLSSYTPLSPALQQDGYSSGRHVPQPLQQIVEVHRRQRCSLVKHQQQQDYSARSQTGRACPSPEPSPHNPHTVLWQYPFPYSYLYIQYPYFDTIAPIQYYPESHSYNLPNKSPTTQ